MKISSIFDPISFVVFGVTFLITMLYLYDKSTLLIYSILAACLNAMLFWITYITLKMCYLAAKKK